MPLKYMYYFVFMNTFCIYILDTQSNIKPPIVKNENENEDQNRSFDEPHKLVFDHLFAGI